MQGFHDDGIKMEEAIPSTHTLVDLFYIKISGNVANIRTNSTLFNRIKLKVYTVSR